MDKFTKKELEYIHRKFMLTNGDDFEHALDSKLQYLIDNYIDYDDCAIVTTSTEV